MGFEEFKPGEPMLEPSSVQSEILLFLELPLIILFNLCPPLSRLFAGEYVTHRESDGWIAEWRTGRLLCSYCGARITRFEFEGRSFSIPAPWRNNTEAEIIETPVGVFMVWKGRWRRGHWESSRYIPHGEFDEQDRRRGWYKTEQGDENSEVMEKREPHRYHPLRPVFRKAGTPEDWSLLARAEPLLFDPRRLAEVLETCGVGE